jgi:hypothetical protein
MIISWFLKALSELELLPGALRLRIRGSIFWPFMISGFFSRGFCRMPGRRLSHRVLGIFVYIMRGIPGKEVFLLVLFIAFFGLRLFLFLGLGSIGVILCGLFFGSGGLFFLGGSGRLFLFDWFFL